MTKDEFLSELNRLLQQHTESRANTGCVESASCSSCVDCVFCKECVRCYRSRYSSGCTESSLLTHCDNCRECHTLAFSQACEHCSDSNYLIYCSHCFECDYCFGCVGLVKKDFHILNRKYSRSEYFKEMANLRAELALPPPEE